MALRETWFSDRRVTYRNGNTSIWPRGIIIALAEFFGTALLIFVTCMGCTDGIFGETIPVAQKSLASGLSVTTAIQIFGHISGAHINPAVTLAALILGEICLELVPIYVVSQLAGSLVGYALLMAVTPDNFRDSPTGHCVTAPNENISNFQACLVEFFATFILVMAVCAAWDPRNRKSSESVPLKIGLIVFLMNISAGGYTFASMNPARSLGPTVWHDKWLTHWVYWVGPMLGGGVGGLLYKYVFLREQT